MRYTLVEIPSPPEGEPNEFTLYDRFALFNRRKPFGLLLRDLPDKFEYITYDQLRLRIEGVMREAEVYRAGDHPPYLFVDLDMLSGVCHLHLQFYKLVCDIESGYVHDAPTWEKTFMFERDRSPDLIVDDILRRVENFIVSYHGVHDAFYRTGMFAP